MKNHVLELPLADARRTRELGERIGRTVGHNAFVALHGPLGAGKTTLVQGVGEGLGVREIINSPTFTMLNEYHSGRLPLYHLDLYRMQDDPLTISALGGKELELLRAELEEFIHGAGVTLIEWAEHFGPYLPADHLVIQLAYTGSEAESAGRLATLEATGPVSQMLQSAVAKMLS